MKKKIILGAMIAAAPFAFAGMATAGHHGGKKLDKMFEKHDTNQDGVISKEEFLAHAEKRFIDMDEDGNNEVSKEEAKAYGEKMKEKWKEKKKKMHDKKKHDKEGYDKEKSAE